MASITAYTTSEGKRYRVRYRKPDRTQTDKRGFTTKRAAELFLASVEVSKAKGEFIDATEGKVTLGELGKVWLDNLGHLKPSSARPLEIAWRLYVSPAWAQTAVSEVRFSAVQKWVTEIQNGRSATTVLRAYGVLASILDVAVKDRRILSNPARGVNLPRKVKKERVYLSHEQVELLVGLCGDKATLVEFMAYTGLRWGEVTALRVRDLDMLRRRAKVQQNAVMVGGRIVVGTPKSHEARSVPFPEFLTVGLAAACEGKTLEQLVFGDGLDFVRPPDSRRGWWISAVRRAREVDPTFPSLTRHDLRHTAASLAVSAGANVKAVQRMLGHASAAMTLDTYADLFDEDLDAVATALNHARLISNVGKMWANGGRQPSPPALLPRK
ncbi:tyrosine-type recombinase/integrase [Parafrigoribacterium humi]|uniref:tyrosine-type recombinase/integrase n=1 Tax=Parafrigoribacterium humi TaxID=3144664 RepID=UPI0032ED0D51